jgi:hypothetical protein
MKLTKLTPENQIPRFEDLGGAESQRERDIWVPVIADCQLAIGNQTRVDTRGDKWIE